MQYASKVKKDKGSTFLSLREQVAAEKKFGKYIETTKKEAKLTGNQKITLVLFGLTFLVMIIGFIPWGEFGITFFDGFTGWLTGSSLGNWWFYEAALSPGREAACRAVFGTWGFFRTMHGKTAPSC